MTINYALCYTDLSINRFWPACIGKLPDVWDGSELGRNTNLYELDGGMQWQQLENCVRLLRNWS
jgi:hypothetical protein